MKSYIVSKLIALAEEEAEYEEAAEYECEIEKDSLQEYFNTYGLITPSDYVIARVFREYQKTFYYYQNSIEEAETEEQLNAGIKKCYQILKSHLQNDAEIIILNYRPYVPFYNIWPEDNADTFVYDKRIAVLASEPLICTVDEDYSHYIRACKIPNSDKQLSKVSRLALSEHYGTSYTLMGATTKTICSLYLGGTCIFNPSWMKVEEQGESMKDQ